MLVEVGSPGQCRVNPLGNVSRIFLVPIGLNLDAALVHLPDPPAMTRSRHASVTRSPSGPLHSTTVLAAAMITTGSHSTSAKCAAGTVCVVVVLDWVSRLTAISV